MIIAKLTKLQYRFLDRMRHKEAFRVAGQQPTAGDFEPLRLVLQPSGLVIELTEPDMVIGRHSTADVRLPLPDVSRRHCRFVYADGCWQVFDLNSLNGVYVNGAPVDQAKLHPRDVVRIGGFTFAVDVPRQPCDDTADSSSVLHAIADAPPRPHNLQAS